MKFINKLIGDSLKWILRSKKIYTTDQHSFITYSQFGEDIILNRIFKNKSDGFYVDVGAFHPKNYSNTNLLHLNGWIGINIEARPGSMKIFNKLRPKDINLELAIGGDKKILTYYSFEAPAFNGFFKSLPKNVPVKLIEKKKINSFPLRDVLEQYLPKNRNIDLLSVDVEGMDYEVLLSNDWDKFKPSVIVVEDFSVSNPLKSKIYKFLISKKYILYACINPSLIFIERSTFLKIEESFYEIAGN